MEEPIRPSESGPNLPRASSVRLNAGPALPLYQESTATDAKQALSAADNPVKLDTSISIQADACDKLPSPVEEVAPAPEDAETLPDPDQMTEATPHAEQLNEDSTVVLTRDQAWVKILAYEACLQVCIKAMTEGAPEAADFLQDSCAKLKTAFGCDGLVLRPPPPGEPANVAGGAKLSWSVTQQLSMPPEDETGTVLRAKVSGFTGLELGKSDKVFVSLHAQSQPDGQGVWTSVAECRQSEAVEMVAAELESVLQVEVHNEQGLVARGTVPISQLWQATEHRKNGAAAASAAANSKVKQSLWRPRPKDTQLAAPRQPEFPTVEVLDNDGNNVGHVALSTNIRERRASSPRRAAPVVKRADGPVTVTTWQVYETVLETALSEQGCGARNLALGGPWRWLLREVAAHYGVRPTFAALAFLRWAAGPERLTPTADCLSMLAQELRPLKRAECNLLPEEVSILGEVAVACEALLAQTFEGYHSLSEKEAGGILSGGASGPESPAPAVVPAVRLFSILKEEGRLRDTVWLQDRLRVAAARRYHRLNRNCVKRITENGYVMENKRNGRLAPIEEGGKPSAETLAYRRLEALCESIRAELENDRLIAETGVLPAGIDLPAVTAPEYCHELIGKVAEVLRTMPPLTPGTAAVDLMLAVGRLQDYVTASGSAAAPGARGFLDAAAIFAPHIQHWIDSSQEYLCKKCLTLESEDDRPDCSPRKKSGKPAVVPLVPAMLAELEAELSAYQRIVTYWPQFGPALEASICAALRDTIAATARQCGLVQQKPQPPPPPQPAAPVSDVKDTPRKLFGRKNKSQPAAPAPLPPQPATDAYPRSPSKRMPWQWRAPGGADSTSVAQAGVAPHEALLLNSLRQLLSAAPAMEATVAGWCTAGRKERRRAAAPATSAGVEDSRLSGSDSGDLDAFRDPELGQHFLQVVGELRSQYAVAVKLAAQRLADAIFASPNNSPAAILDKLWEAIGPVVDSRQPYWQRLSQPADPNLNSQQHVAPLLKVLKDTVEELGPAVDGRVLVALTRGLWELTAKEIHDYLEGLQESFDTKNAWRSRQNAALMLDHVDAFFRDSLSAGPKTGWQGGVTLHEQDLERPFHSNKAHFLLSANTSESNMSFNPY